MRQTLAFHLQLRPQILWVDAWVHQISLAFLGAVCAVQLAKIMNRRLPQRPSNWLIRSCCALGSLEYRRSELWKAAIGRPTETSMKLIK